MRTFFHALFVAVLFLGVGLKAYANDTIQCFYYRSIFGTTKNSSIQIGPGIGVNSKKTSDLTYCQKLLDTGIPTAYYQPWSPSAGGQGGVSTTGSGSTCYASNLKSVGPYTYCSTSSSFDGAPRSSAAEQVVDTIWVVGREVLMRADRLPGVYNFERAKQIASNLNESLTETFDHIQKLQTLNEYLTS